MSQSEPSGELPSEGNAPGAPKQNLIRRQPYLQQLAAANAELEDRLREAQGSPQAAQSGARVVPSPPMADFEETLKRLVDQIAKLLQAEKCVFFMHDPAAGTLYATYPALGFTRNDLHRMERAVTSAGLTSEVFRTNDKLIILDALDDPRAVAENLLQFGVRNAVSVPLIVEKRDKNNQLIDKHTVGVLHAFNKKGGKTWIKEDLWLLERMANTGAAVIKWAQLYRDVVQKEQDYIHTIDSLFAGLLVVGTNGRLQQINPSARGILRIGEDAAVLGVPYDQTIRHERVCALLQRALQAGSHEIADEITVDVPHAEQDGGIAERIYQIQCAPVRDEQGVPAGIVAILNDITEIRGVERMKDAFISTVTHELRTPLTSIKGFITTLLEDENDHYEAGTRKEFYGIISAECDRLSHLIADLLDISRIQHGGAMQLNWQDVDVAALCENVMRIQRATAKKHTFEVETTGDIPAIEADPEKITQILTNLVSNAIKYSPDGGAVRLSVSRAGLQRERVAIQVTDEGMGIGAEHLPKLFDRFYRVDNRDTREIGGTGIGLALVKGLTEAHQGTVSVASELKRGTTFTVTIPIRQNRGNG